MSMDVTGLSGYQIMRLESVKAVMLRGLEPVWNWVEPDEIGNAIRDDEEAIEDDEDDVAVTRLFSAWDVLTDDEKWAYAALATQEMAMNRDYSAMHLYAQQEATAIVIEALRSKVEAAARG